MTGQDPRTETPTRRWWVRLLLATGLAAAVAQNGGAPLVPAAPR